MSLGVNELRLARWAGDLLGISAVILVVAFVISAAPVGEPYAARSAIAYAFAATVLGISLVAGRFALARLGALRRSARIVVWCAVAILQALLATSALLIFSPSGVVFALFLLAPVALSCFGLLFAFTSRHTEQA